MVEPYLCPSYYDDQGVLQDCKCGKCEEREREYRVHKAHCFMIVQPENEFMGCKYGRDEDCPVRKPYPADPIDNENFKQVGTIFGMPLLVDLTNTIPEDRVMMLDRTQLVLQKSFNARVKQMDQRDDRLVRPCEECGKPITPRAADVARGWGRFCSKRCKAIYQVKHG